MPANGTAAAVAAARDEAVARMLTANPEVVDYLRRAVLDPSEHRSQLLQMLTTLTAERVSTLRRSGVASRAHKDSSQVIGVMVRQRGQLFLQPMIDTMWIQLAGAKAKDEHKPQLVVKVQEPPEPR